MTKASWQNFWAYFFFIINNGRCAYVLLFWRGTQCMWSDSTWWVSSSAEMNRNGRDPFAARAAEEQRSEWFATVSNELDWNEDFWSPSSVLCPPAMDSQSYLPTGVTPDVWHISMNSMDPSACVCVCVCVWEREREREREREFPKGGGGCLVAQLCPTLCDPMDCSIPGFPVLHYLQEFVQTHVHWVSDAIQPSDVLLSPSPLNLSQHQGLFQWVGFSHQLAKGLELQHQHQSFQ